MNKNLSTEIMKRSKLGNKFLKSGSDEDMKRYLKQQSLCVSLLRKTKKTFIGTSTKKMLQSTKTFGKL